ncbi:exodeoxyribonuclease VII large subunit [Cryomorpha ignava]|uniref:Exodeoxyribonuclease 7 large subunit n=1 Tax=Cryomorpha ignava TaxID=101383 RepID=A0A7K3WSN7_9FLAO|nr:exodeoxyribonuclease VII large subunit [Cryomorpha ignava]NEN24710.1 exodeoxyribonuclease VII large subunit [Cryomorpha ignava]
MADMNTSAVKKHYSLSELARSLSSQIEKTYSKSYWITAEISKLNYYPQSGHCYPQLVEKKSGKIVADLKGFILKSKYQHIRTKFLELTGKEPGDGMQILFLCTLGFHAVYGLSLNILDIEPSYTLGEMARMRTEAIKKLKAEGIFDQNKSLYLPLLVQNVAVISVETSKGFLDFKNVLASSPFPNSINLRLFPALLQGDAAVASIIAALTKIRQVDIDFDAVVIIRGGGGETGLDCYDSYNLARNVSLFPIPILTGIGHATNLTVVEQVAYKNLITPTDLARNLVQNFIDFATRLKNVKRSLTNFRKGWFTLTRNELDAKANQLELAVSEKLANRRNHIRRSANRINNGVENALVEAKASINYRMPMRLNGVVKNRFETCNRKLNAQPASLAHSTMSQLKESQTNLGFIADKLRILDPANTLKRGFSITTLNGKTVNNADELEPGAELETRLWKGTVKSTVK